MSKARDLANFISSGAITATANEINTLDGITATTAELNYTDGVTAAIQAQIDNNKSSITATASGAITAGDVTILNSNGTVSTAGAQVLPDNYTEGFSSIDSTFYSDFYGFYYAASQKTIFVEGSHNKLVYAFKDEASVGHVVVGSPDSASTDTITWGSKLQFSGLNDTVNEIDMLYEPNADRILIAYSGVDSGGTPFLRMKSFSLSGTTLTETAYWSVLYGTNSAPDLTSASLAYNSAQNTCVICYVDGQYPASDNDVDAKTFYVTSNNIVGYSNYTINADSGDHTYRPGVVYDPSSGNYLFCFHRNADGKGYIKVAQPTGSSTSPGLSQQSAQVMLSAFDLINHSGQLAEVSSFIYDSTTSSIILQGKMSNDGFLQRYSISGLTVSQVGGVSLWNDTSETGLSSNQSNISYNPDDNTYQVTWTTGQNANELAYRTVTLSGTTNTLGDIVYINTSSLTTPSALYHGYTVYDTYTNKQFTIIGDRNAINTSYYDIKYGYLQSGEFVYTLTPENFIGFAQNTVANTETVTIHSNGRTDANQSGLTPGQSYYASKVDGSLGTTPGSDAVFVGTALSATEIRITSDDNATKLFTTDAGVVSVDGTDAGFNILGNATAAAEFEARSYNETYAAVTSTTNATTVNCETGNSFSHTLTENTTFTFSNPPASGTAYSFSIEIIQDASASGFTVTWPTSVDWPAATAPTLTATASAKDVFVFTTRDGGINWYGFTAGQALG